MYFNDSNCYHSLNKVKGQTCYLVTHFRVPCIILSTQFFVIVYLNSQKFLFGSD